MSDTDSHFTGIIESQERNS